MVRVNDLTGETLYKASDMSRQQADIQSLRLKGLTQQEIANTLDMDIDSVKSQCSRINNKKNVRLPEISKVETEARVSPEEHPAVVFWFDNGAKLRYVNQNGTVLEEVFKADDPDSVYESYDIRVEPDEMKEAALESIAEYVNTYRNDLDATRKDWPHVFEAITLISA